MRVHRPSVKQLGATASQEVLERMDSIQGKQAALCLRDDTAKKQNMRKASCCISPTGDAFEVDPSPSPSPAIGHFLA